MDGLGNPLRFVLTAGQVHDSTQARALVEGLTGAYLLADKAYDSNEFRDVIAEHGMVAVIPSNRSRSMAIPYDKHLYKERHLVEWTLLAKVETSCDRILIAGGANVEAEWEQGPAV